MTSFGDFPECDLCERYDSETDTCEAYPKGIPDAILLDLEPHDQLRGDETNPLAFKLRGDRTLEHLGLWRKIAALK